MKQLLPLFLFAFVPALLKAQSSEFSLQVHYGPQANFETLKYDEAGYARQGMTAFLNKDLVGLVGGFDLAWHLSQRSSIAFGYSRAVNSKTISYTGTMGSANIFITDFNLREVNKFFQLYYSFDFRKARSEFNIQTGLFYVRSSQQEIILMPPYNQIEITERNYKNSRLEEGGIFLGLAYSHKIDTRFSLGIKSRLYYTASIDAIQSLTLTPTLTYHFGTPKNTSEKKNDTRSKKMNTVYFELGGNGIFGSLNYERQLTKNPGLAARAGIGYYADHGNFATFPLGLNYLLPINKKNGFLDAGFGVTFTTEPATSGNGKSIYYIPSIGYRKYRKDIMLRASLTPIIGTEVFTPWIGLSIGKRF